MDPVRRVILQYKWKKKCYISVTERARRGGDQNSSVFAHSHHRTTQNAGRPTPSQFFQRVFTCCSVFVNALVINVKSTDVKINTVFKNNICNRYFTIFRRKTVELTFCVRPTSKSLSFFSTVYISNNYSCQKNSSTRPKRRLYTYEFFKCFTFNVTPSSPWTWIRANNCYKTASEQ